MNAVVIVVMAVIMLPLGALVWSMYSKIAYKEKMEKAKIDLEHAKERVASVTKEAELKAQEILLEGIKKTETQKSSLLQEFKEREKRLNKREEQLTAKDELIIAKEKELKVEEKKQKETEEYLEKQKSLVAEELGNVKTELEKIAGMTQEEAKEKLIQKIEDEAKHIASKKLKVIEDALNEDSEKMAKRIVSTAIQRYSGEHCNYSKSSQ